ncbi:aldose epimerase family protein [Geosporobacter ferrireducens]|uniref:Aldose 1-epimerase n=1 Tax=Geosporobacter ferrireducens TaxID=1424294 RepID=A0A1D8GL03_9FIRM|nr:aldose epimerase family protein [Geosporobacter ferrireducens]AOT71584.1 hypothetical protein Gferi_19840 [Geosporobacter ferrireducens]
MILKEEILVLEGKLIKGIMLENRQHMTVKLLNYGAAVVELLVPDREKKSENIVLTHEKIGDYLKNPSCFGVTLGRTSGRIANGSFSIDGKAYTLEKNFGVNHGHGGLKNFSHQIWDYKIEQKEACTTVIFQYTSKDMEEGYPGNLEVQVSYTLTEENELLIEYEGVTDKKTLCNLTNHSYFNLSGNYRRKVTEQKLKIRSDQFLELNENQVPTGRFIDVTHTPMDFRHLKRIGKDIESDYVQLRRTNGYDHPWILEGKESQIEMIDEISGRKMSVSTTYPSVVVYSYNYPNQEKLKGGKVGSKYDGICFETQYEPDGINHAHLHQGILDVGERYDHKTLFKFTTV